PVPRAALEALLCDAGSPVEEEHLVDPGAGPGRRQRHPEHRPDLAGADDGDAAGPGPGKATRAAHAARRPTASAIFRTSCIIRAKASASSDCAPSDSASDGFGWTSTSRPSAPAAMPARATGVTRSDRPTAWLGSTITGSELMCFSTG